jgi:hypothetical protein
MSADILADRCAALALTLPPLMGAAIGAQGNPKVLDEVLEHIAGVRAAVKLDAAAGDAYHGWAVVTPRILDGMEQAARAGDARTVWALFTDQTDGFHRLGAICAGYPGW